MTALPTNRTVNSTREQHLADHLELHRRHNAFDWDSTPEDGDTWRYDAEAGLYRPVAPSGTSLPAWREIVIADADWDLAGAVGVWEVADGVITCHPDDVADDAFLNLTPRVFGTAFAFRCDIESDCTDPIVIVAGWQNGSMNGGVPCGLNVASGAANVFIENAAGVGASPVDLATPTTFGVIIDGLGGDGTVNDQPLGQVWERAGTSGTKPDPSTAGVFGIEAAENASEAGHTVTISNLRLWVFDTAGFPA